MPHNPKCWANHMGVWACEPAWLSQAVAAIRAGTWRPQATAATAGGEVVRWLPPPFVAETATDTGASATWTISGASSVNIDAAARPRGDADLYTVAGNGIAVIPIAGPMMKGRSKFGGVSTVETRRAIRTADRDPDVRGIMLHVDSPGGHAAGTQDLADDVRATGKPIVAHIDDLGASAAYWAISQSDRISVNRGGEVGSIGALAVVSDTSKAADMAGVTVHVVATGEYKGALTPGAPIPDEQLDYVRSRVEHINGLFLRAVESGRGLRGRALSAVSDGRVYGSSDAGGLGLVDAVESFDSALGVLGETLDGMEKSRERRRAMASDIRRAELRSRLRRA